MNLLARPPGSTDDAAETLTPALIEIDAWNGTVRRIEAPRDPDCPACVHGELPYLHGAPPPEPVVLCGRNTVQLPPRARPPDLAKVAENLPGGAREVRRTRTLLRFSFDDVRLTLFADGRALVEGTEDADRARALLDRAIGN